MLLLLLLLLLLLRDPMRDHLCAYMRQDVLLAAPLPLPLPPLSLFLSLSVPLSLSPFYVPLRLPLCLSLSPCDNSLIGLGARLSISLSLYQLLPLPLSRLTSERSQPAYFSRSRWFNLHSGRCPIRGEEGSQRKTPRKGKGRSCECRRPVSLYLAPSNVGQSCARRTACCGLG